MPSMFAHEFMRQALAAGLLASVACGVVGTYVVVRRLSASAGGIAHASYGGIGLGFYLGFDPLIGAGLFAVAAGLLIGLADRRFRHAGDTMIGVIWAVGMAIGVVLVAMTPGFAPNLMSYLFGSILIVTRGSLALMAALDALVLAVVVLLYRPLQSVVYDEEFAEVGRLPAGALYMLLLCLVALTSVVTVKVAGIILVIALLTIPSAIAAEAARSLREMMILSVLLAALFAVGGLIASYQLGMQGVNVPSGAAIVILAGAAYALTLGVKSVHRRWLART